MKKIIGFDSWTGGANKFTRLIAARKPIGLDLQLAHLGSWGNEPEINGSVPRTPPTLSTRDGRFFSLT